MAGVHERTDAGPVAGFEVLPRPEGPLVLGGHVPGPEVAHPCFVVVVVGKGTRFHCGLDVLGGGVPQQCDSGVGPPECLRGGLALGHPDGIFPAPDAVLDVGVGHHQYRHRILSDQRGFRHFGGHKVERPAVDQQEAPTRGGAANGLVHDAAGGVAPLVLGLLAAECPRLGGRKAEGMTFSVRLGRKGVVSQDRLDEPGHGDLQRGAAGQARSQGDVAGDAKFQSELGALRKVREVLKDRSQHVGRPGDRLGGNRRRFGALHHLERIRGEGADKAQFGPAFAIATAIATATADAAPAVDDGRVVNGKRKDESTGVIRVFTNQIDPTGGDGNGAGGSGAIGIGIRIGIVSVNVTVDITEMLLKQRLDRFEFGFHW
mmetsp:Transcript_9275/g.27632  ORF Transcript_9275/g.27632 Transcript_9275/m.27632 type:complete len:374 (+) Transcript_9275:435-1556(+)